MSPTCFGNHMLWWPCHLPWKALWENTW